MEVLVLLAESISSGMPAKEALMKKPGWSKKKKNKEQVLGLY
jgi:hypothetical protein